MYDAFNHRLSDTAKKSLIHSYGSWNTCIRLAYKIKRRELYSVKTNEVERYNADIISTSDRTLNHLNVRCSSEVCCKTECLISFITYQY